MFIIAKERRLQFVSCLLPCSCCCLLTCPYVWCCILVHPHVWKMEGVSGAAIPIWIYIHQTYQRSLACMAAAPACDIPRVIFEVRHEDSEGWGAGCLRDCENEGDDPTDSRQASAQQPAPLTTQLLHFCTRDLPWCSSALIIHFFTVWKPQKLFQ